jgi:hypothetical protein
MVFSPSLFVIDAIGMFEKDVGVELVAIGLQHGS